MSASNLLDNVLFSAAGSAVPHRAQPPSPATTASGVAGADAGRGFKGRSAVAVEDAVPSSAAPLPLGCASGDPPANPFLV